MDSKAKPSPKAKELKGEAAAREYRKQVSPQGVRAAEEAARKALEKKYPGMFIPKTRTGTAIPPMIPGR